MTPRWLTPFHWPGRDRRFLSGLPRGQLRRYNLMWLDRPSSWAWVAGAMAILAAAVAVDFAGRPWMAGVLVGVFVPYWLVFNHRESRLRRSLVERDHPMLCRTCGYDRRGSPGRPCPECGAAPTIAP